MLPAGPLQEDKVPYKWGRKGIPHPGSTGPGREHRTVLQWAGC